MNKLAIVILSLVLSSCATYKVVTESGFSKDLKSSENIIITKENEWPEGKHCFEPMMYVLTLGIIPTHCVDTYSVTSGSRDLGKVKVTSMQGWVALFIAPFPRWRFGYGSEVESQIKEIVSLEK